MKMPPRAATPRLDRSTRKNSILYAKIGLFSLLALLGTLALTGCGNNGNSEPPVAPAPPVSTITSVAVSCDPSTVAPGATSQCTATVQGTGDFSSQVTWTASGGTIDSSGVFTAPASPGSITVTATSTQDTTKSGNATITVQAASSPPPPPSSTITSVAVSCNPSTVAPKANSQCNATVQGTGSFSSKVTWVASGGTIDSSGVFTAPASAATITVTATSSQDATKSGNATVTVQTKTSATAHVVLVMEENQSYSTVVGNATDWPNLNHLIQIGALPTHFYANTHPSIGNYFMLTTGQILTNDDSSTKVWDVDNLARRMLSAGVSFRIYAEGIPNPGYLGGNTGDYFIRHNPFAMLSDVADDPKIANQVIQPFSQFAVDLANGNLPTFSYIIPDINDDAHSGPPHKADEWLQTNVVGPLSSTSIFEPGGDGVLIVNFDEAADSDKHHGGGHIAPVFWGPIVKTGYTQSSSTIYQQQSLLRAIMDLLHLPNPLGAAATAPSMSEFFVQK